MKLPPKPHNFDVGEDEMMAWGVECYKAGLEAAAKVVDEFAADPDVTDGIADAIRAMKEEV